MDLQTFQAKTSKKPRSPLFARVASEYLKSGSIAEAKAVCTKGLEIFPSYVGGRVVLAKCFAAEKDYNSALANLTKALRFAPDSQNLLRLKKEWEGALANPAGSPGTSALPAAEPAYPAAATDGTTALAVLETPPEPAVMKPPSEPVLPDPSAQQVAREAQGETVPEPLPAVECTDAPPAAEGEGPQGLENLEKRISGSETVESLPDIMEIPFMGSPDATPPPAPVREEPRVEEPVQEPPVVPIETRGPIQTDRPEVDYEGRIVSKTLAEIYAQQGEFAEAILTYQLLKYRRHDLTAEIDDRIRELQDMLSSKSSG